MSFALGKNGRQRFLCGETSTAAEQRRKVPEHYFFRFFSFPKSLELLVIGGNEARPQYLQ